MNEQEPAVVIGRVKSVNPAQRQLRIEPEPGYERQFQGMTWLRVMDRSRREMRCKAVRIAISEHEGVIAVLAPGVSRDVVAAMKSAAIVVDQAELKPPSGDDFVPRDLVGLQVVNELNEVLGDVTEAFETPAHVIIEYVDRTDRVMRLPLIESVVTMIDFAQAALRVRNVDRHVVCDED